MVERARPISAPSSHFVAWQEPELFATEEKYRREFARLIWRTASPKWEFDEATFDRSVASFDNPTT